MKTVLQVQTGKFNSKSLFSIIKDITKSEGIMQMWSGLTPALIGNIISWGLYFSFYNESKSLYLKYTKKYLLFEM